MNTLKNSWHHIRRSPVQSFFAVFIMVLGFFLITSFAVFNDGLMMVLRNFETKPEITIFLKDEITPEIVSSLQKELENYPNVREIRYISKEKALDIYRQQNEDNPMLTEMVTSSILPASFEVSVTDPSVLEEIDQNFSAKKDLVDEIIYQKDIIKNLLNWTSLIRHASTILIASVLVIAFFVNLVIVGLKITSRKDEIRISRLLGASNFYVIRPFLLEGIIYGAIGSLIGSLLSFAIALHFRPLINGFFNPVMFIRQDNYTTYLVFIGFNLLLGSLTGYLASWIGVRRYIKF